MPARHVLLKTRTPSSEPGLPETTHRSTTPRIPHLRKEELPARPDSGPKKVVRPEEGCHHHGCPRGIHGLIHERRGNDNRRGQQGMTLARTDTTGKRHGPTAGPPAIGPRARPPLTERPSYGSHPTVTNNNDRGGQVTTPDEHRRKSRNGLTHTHSPTHTTRPD